MNRQILTPRRTLLIATVLLALAVILGAFGAHGLEERLSEKALSTYQTGVTYHYYHAFALGLVALWEQSFGGRDVWAKILFLAGILLFSFNCYLYAVTSIKAFAMIVPVGGLCFILGWLAFAYRCWDHNPPK